eukprot:TRINITY_DN30656_c0_g1_i1.p1 TRINITY_DN30656_c0_g1~~TRINITY_DN30656_c0_g1_i1.p1  ORF type:complete len:308 (-),score=42.54 TRINITY_DN30656_c0_g1_i1:517-1389(-)
MAAAELQSMLRKLFCAPLARPGAGLNGALRNGFAAYGLFVLSWLVALRWLSSITSAYNTPVIWYFSAILEGYGLVFLRHRIAADRSVFGVSGQSVGIFSVTYLVRALTLPPFKYAYLFMWGLKIFDWVSFALILDILRCVFFTYRKSYQEDLDVLHLKALLPVSAVVALLFCPDRGSGTSTGLCFAFMLNLDVIALLPQVIMMGRQETPVKAPIAHFVIATAVSRLTDLWYWTEEFQVWSRPAHVSMSGWFIIGEHIVNALIISDFLYYYIRACISAGSVPDDIDLPIDL